MKISYSAPGKVILSGEHAVVYGNPALVSAIDLRLIFTISSRSYKDSNLSKEILIVSNQVKSFLSEKKINFVNKPFSYEIKSAIPVGRGLGSSAALSVAVVAAFLEFYTGKKFEKEIINNLAFEIEKHFHKNPSGVDNSSSCFGGLILYQKQKNLKNLDYKIPKNIEEKLFLIDSGKPGETTGEMVDFARTKVDKKILMEIEITTSNLITSIKKQDEVLFKQCLVKNENLLEKLEIVSEKTKKLLSNLSIFGGGKVTGAGGRETNSGFIFFLADDKKRLKEYLKRKKINYYQFIPDYRGLVRHPLEEGDP
ncbi:MAG: hypothetical protein ACD_12C00604G0005 [uncultured bacterium]|nr:MAG: hypothetical protein ACD_12C00604G0005 [uncultured bacterium]